MSADLAQFLLSVAGNFVCFCIGAAVTSGPLMTHPDYTRYVREGATFTADDLRRAWEMCRDEAAYLVSAGYSEMTIRDLTPPDYLPARVKEGRDE